MKLVDGLSRKGYKPGDQGTMQIPYPKRDPQWRSDPPVHEARQREDDEFWIDVLKKRHTDEDRIEGQDALPPAAKQTRSGAAYECCVVTRS